MTVFARFRLSTPQARQNASRACLEAPADYICEISEETRTLEQNSHAHAALTEIARHVTWHGQRFDVLTWKRLTQASFLREQGEAVRLIPALDGNGFDIIYEKTSRWGKKKFAAWLEWVYAFGAEHGVVFRDVHHDAA